MITEEKWLQYDGENWEEVLYFLKGRGSLIKEYEYKTSGEIITYIHIEDLDMNVVVSDIVVYIDDELLVFSEEHWKLYNKPEIVIEFERLLNILMDSVKPEVSIFSIIEDIFDDNIEIIPLGIDFESMNIDTAKMNQYSINGYDCTIDKNDDIYEVNLV